MGVLVLKHQKKLVYVLLPVIVLIIGLWSGGHAAREAVSETAALAQTRPQLIIDAGHGGEDGGARGVSGVQESQINLEISMRLRALLQLLGQKPIMIRETDTSVHSEGADSISEKKVSDLHNRAKLVTETPGALLLSIHQNSFPEGKYKGAQTFYAPTGASDQLAEKLQHAFREQLDPTNRREAKPVDKAVYLLNHINATGVLIECGFLSNAEEEAALATETYQKKLAAVIAAVTVKFMEETNEI